MSKLVIVLLTIFALSAVAFCDDQAQIKLLGEPTPKPVLVIDPAPVPPKADDAIYSCDKFRSQSKEDQSELCTKENPVCGWFGPNIQCFAYPCAGNYSNPCLACANENVSGYSYGNCPPVGGYVDDGDDNDDDDDDDDDDDIDRKSPKRYTCKDGDRNQKCKKRKCRNSKQFVCAYLSLRCIYGECTSYYRTRCDACKDKHVASVSKGLCPKDKELDNYPVYYCKPKDRNARCTEEYKGVCAISEGGSLEVGTICQGCAKAEVIAVYDAKCPLNK